MLKVAVFTFINQIKDGLATSFVLNNNKVVEVDISYVGFTTSK